MSKLDDLGPDAGTDNPEAVVEAFFDSLDEPENTEPTEHEAVPTLDDPAGDPEDEDEDSDEDSEEPQAEVEEQPVAEEEESLDPNEKRLRDLQSYHDKKMIEVQQQLTQMNQWAQTVYQQQLATQQAAQEAARAAQAAPQAAETVHVTDQQLIQAVDQDIERAFVWTAQNRPDLMHKVITAARENPKHGHATADQMQLEYTEYKQQQLVQQQQEWIQAQQEAAQAAQQPEQVRGVMANLITNIEQQYGAAYKAVEPEFIARAQETAPDFQQYIAQQGLEMTPDAIHYFLTKTFNDIREEKLSAQAAKPRRARKVTPSEHMESSTTGHRPENATADDLAINELLEGAKSLSIDVSPTL